MFELWSFILASASKQRLQDVTKSVAGAISFLLYTYIHIVFGDTTAAAAAVICFATCSLIAAALSIFLLSVLLL
jgi:hypothetical protein